jgi:hypothetical protein
MADKNYNIDYTAKDSASAVTDALMRRVIALEVAVSAAKARLNGFAAGGNRSAAAMTKRVSELLAELNKLNGTLGTTNASLNLTASNSNSAGLSIGKMRLAFMAMHEAVEVLDAIGDGIRDARDEVDKLAESNLKLRDSMRELANLQGHEGPDDEVAGEVLALGMASGMKPDEAVKFLEQFEGSIPAGRQLGNIGAGKNAVEKKELERAMALEGAAFSARLGINPETGGDLSGVISQYTKIGKIEDFAGQLGAMAYGLNEGRGKLTPLIRGELGQAGAAVTDGRVKDLAELGSFIGVASTVAKSAGSSGTKFSQMDALLNTVGGEQGDYLQSIGVSDKKGDLAKLKELRKDLDKNGGGDWSTYLYSKGFHNKTDRQSTVAMARNIDVLEQRIATARGMVGRGGETIAADAAFLGRTITGQNRKSLAAEAASDFIKGSANESIVVAQRNATSRLKLPGVDAIDTPLTKATDAIFDHTIGALASPFGITGNRQSRINKEMLRSLEEKGKSVGVNFGYYHGGTLDQGNVNAEVRRRQDEIRKKDPNANVMGDSKEVAQKLDKLIAIGQQQLAGQKQNAAPPPPPRGKGGAVPGRP